MTEAYASSPHSGDHRPTSPYDEDIDIPSMTAQKGDLSFDTILHDGSQASLIRSDEDIPSTTIRKGDLHHETLHDGGIASLIRSDRTLRFWCYGLHAFLVVIHAGLVVMLFTHPEHRFSVSIDNTAATIALKAFLQAFYTAYTAVLVLMIQRLTISTAMAKRQKLTAIHDICGAWNGIGAAVHTLWQQTKVMSSPLTIFMILAYMSCISSLHIVSSSVIQFEAFNNTISNVVPSTLAWPFSSSNLANVDWPSVSPLTALWPLLPTAKGLDGSMLYDVPRSNLAYTGAVVNTTTISADCGLLSNSSAGMWNETVFHVNVSGLGEVALELSGPNLVSFIELNSPILGFEYPCPLCHNYIGFKISTGIDLGNLTGQVIQVDANISIWTSADGTDPNLTVPSKSFIVACTLNATNTTQSLPMKDGLVVSTEKSLSEESESETWKIWSPGSTTELTQIFSTPQHVEPLSLACLQIQSLSYNQQCQYMSAADGYLNNLVGIPWMFGSAATAEVLPSHMILEYKTFKDAVAQMAAGFIWLASTFDIENQQTPGLSSVTNLVLELRLNINTTPVAFGLFASVLLFVILAWMLHDSHPRESKITVTSPSILELMWISAHSATLQDSMTRAGSSIPDQLRTKGIKIQACLSNMNSGPIRYYKDEDNLQSSSMGYTPNWQQFVAKEQSSIYLWCYVLHGILFGLHVVLIVLLIYHPEHDVIMPMYNTWVATALSICLQAFYVLYTAVLVFVVQQLATSKLITERHYLTTVHDIANAWTGVGAAVSTLWQQTNLLSSIWAIIGVTLYLICISVMHISSTTIMQFTAYNSTSTISVPTTVPWPNNSVISNGSWADAIQTMPPINLIHDIQSNGLQNTTLYDILTTIQPSFTNATVNATSLQASCGLLSNLSFYTIQELGNINFSTDGLGQGSCSFEVGRGLTLEVGMTVLNVPRENNLVANLQLSTLGNSYVLKNCSLCYQYLFFIITADIDIDGSVITNATNLSCNIAQDDSPPVMAYLAACSLIPETTHATLDLQTNSLIPSLTQTSSQSWKLWSPNPGASSDFMLDVFELIYATPFMTCPTDGGICSMSTNVSVAAQNNSPYILAPNQLEQSIEQLVAAKIWMSGQIGPSQGGFQQINGQSPVTQVITEWRLNINAVPVIFASGASLVLLILGFLLVGMPPRFARHRPSINGVSVLETLWIAAHSRTICEHMADIEEPSLDNLRKAGMFTIRLGDIYASRVMVPESEAFLE